MSNPRDQVQQYSLRIGDVVFLYSKEGNGYVFSECSSTHHLSLATLPVTSPDDPNLPDIRMAAFKVLAPNKNKAQQRLSDLEKRLQGDTMTADEKMQLFAAKKNVEVEVKSNRLEQERRNGSLVRYGSVVQLLHVYSGKYVSISTVKISKTENSNMEMKLIPHDSEHCLFRILPRYKVRSVGDQVHMEDQVIFAGKETEGQYMHTSSKTYHQVGVTLHGQCHEVNAAASQSGYTIKPHYLPAIDEQKEPSLKAGNVIRLFHREIECYLVAEGSFANDEGKVIVEQVHLRKRKSEHGRLKAPSTSSITYWQIEKDAVPLSGQTVNWGERCRIKHLPTRLYLAVIKNESDGLQVTLKERDSFSQKADLDIIFRLFPVIEEDTAIEFESYARISHPHTKTWLVARQEEYCRQAFDPNASGLDSLQWDSADLLQIGVQDHMSYDDAFTIEKVGEELISKFNYVAGMVPVIKAYINEIESVHNKAIGIKKADLAQKALDELSDFMKYAHPRIKDHQKLLRNLMILEMLIRVLKNFSANAPDANIQRVVGKACYRVLEVYLIGNSRKNENYLARFIPFFETQVGLDLNAENSINELVRDNRLIVSKYDENKIDEIISNLLKGKISQDSRFFEKLGVLCVCNDRPLPEKQNQIIEKLVKIHGKELFYLTEIGGSKQVPNGNANTIYFHTPNDPPGKWHPLHDIAAKDKSKQSKNYQYLVAQLDLFGKLCKGNNVKAVEIIDKEFNYLTFEEALIGAQDDGLHPAVRSKYVELIIVLYVDVGNNRAILDNLSFSFVYSKVVEDPYESAAANPTKALTGSVNVYFPALRDWIKLHVEKHQSVTGSRQMIDVNNFNAKVLDLLYLLVKYGYYADLKDINVLMPPLISLLNGMNDKPFPNASDEQSVSFRKEGRYEDNQENKAIFNLKTKALKVMDLFFNFRLFLRLQHFIYDYKLLKGDVDPNQEIEDMEEEYEEDWEDQDEVEDDKIKHRKKQTRFVAPPASLHQLTHRVTHVTSGLTHHVTHVTSGLTHQVTNVTHQVQKHVTGMFGGSKIQRPLPPPELREFQKSSRQLKIHKNERLMNLANERLKTVFSYSDYDFGSVTDARGLSTILIDLSKYQNNEILHEALHLLQRYYSAEENLFEKAIQTQLLITEASEQVFNEVSFTHLPLLRHLAEVDVNEDQCQQLLNTLETLTHICHLEGDLDEPHTQNQKILYNTGVFTDVLNLVFQENPAGEVTQASGAVDAGMKRREMIISKCLQFLKFLARKNKIIQKRLYDNMDDLLQLDVAIPDMAEVLTEVFTGNQEICLKIKEQQLEKIFELIVEDGCTGRSELLGLLKAIAKVEELDLPLKRNQAYIIKYFSITRDSFCGELLGLEEEKQQRRQELLVKADDSDPTLQMLLKLVDLLASCCEGENLFIESVCQNIMSINELIQILAINDLDPRRKRPFLRYLLWVYMNVGGDKIQIGSIILYHDWQLWRYLEHISLLLEGVTKALQELPADQVFEAKHQLTTQSLRLKKHGRVIKAMTAAQNIPFVTDEKGEIAPGILLYIMEGVLPMLKTFYSGYFHPFDKSSDKIIGDSTTEVTPGKEIQISASIARGLLYLVDVIVGFLSSQDQWELLRTTILTILKHDCYEEGMLNLDSRVWTRFNLRTKVDMKAQSESREKFRKEYVHELKLNDEFNNFVRNFELAYWGPNTAQHQVHSPYDIAYSEFKDPLLLEVRGDEWLPLGPSFQQHISLYVSRGQNTTKVTPTSGRIIDCLVSSYDNLANIDKKERQRQDTSDIRYLRLLRAMIHNEVMFIDPDAREGQNPALFRKQSERLRSVQSQIQSFQNTVEKVVILLSHPNEMISAEVLAFLAAMLYTGNKDVQKGFSYLLETREEKLFTNMQYRLQQASITDRERRILLSQLESRAEAQKSLNAALATTKVSAVAQITGIEKPMNLQEPSATEQHPADETGIFFSPTTKLLSLSNFGMDKLDGTEDNYYEVDTSFSTVKEKRPVHRNNEELIADIELTENKIALQKLQSDLKPTVLSSGKVSSLKFKDTSHIELGLRVLGLMCDGQYRPMQNYLREQPDNIKTINLVSEICTFLQSFYIDATKDNIFLINQVFQTLIEMSVGNFTNLQILFDHQIVDTINRILQTVVFQQCSLTDVLELKHSAVELLEAMCEEIHPETEKLVQNIFKDIDIDALQSTMVYFYKLSQDSVMKHEEKQDIAEKAAFRTYLVLVHMADFEGISLSDVEPRLHVESTDVVEIKCDADLKEAWEYCERNSKNIEIIYEDDDHQKTLAKVHFRFNPKDELPEEIIEKVKFQVNRDSPEDKLRDFMEWMVLVGKEVFHLNSLRDHWYSTIFMRRIKWRNNLLTLWTLVMNIMLVVAWSDVDITKYYDIGNDTLSGYCQSVSCHGDTIANSTFMPSSCDSNLCRLDTPTTPNQSSHWFFDYALYIGGGIHLLMSLAMFISYLLNNAGNFVLPAAFYKHILRYQRIPTYSDEPFFGLRSLYHIAFVVFSALSLPFYGYFYCFCLLNIVIDNEILQQVLKSVTKNGRSLLWVGALGLVVIYIYGVGTFAFLPNEFHDTDEDATNVRFCQSLIQCFISVLEYGLLNTLGSTASLPTNFEDAALRAIFFDLTFFIIVSLIGVNVVFGIIVDTFAELRNKRWRIEEDMKGNCFICSIPNYEFERRAKGFDHHVQCEHSMWNYIYFYLYLQRIDISDHNAIESYAYHQIKRHQTDFFPLFQARSLKAMQDNTSTQLAELREMMTDIIQHFKQEEKDAALRRKQEEDAKWEQEQRKIS